MLRPARNPFWWYLGQSFSDLPPPNRAGGFPRTRLSSTDSHPFKHRAGFTHYTTCSLSGETTRTCSPSSCLRHYPKRLATMGTPSPSGSRLVGDPAFAHMRRSVRVGAPFASLPCSLPGTHRREPSRAVVYCSLFPRGHRGLWSNGVAASGMLRRAPNFTVGNWGSTNPGFTMRTGLAELIYLHPFGPFRFAGMLLSPSGFPSRLASCPRRCLRSRPPAPVRQSHVRRNGAPQHSAWHQFLSNKI